ncbi:hypothetical protein Moror_3321 [Moniliophthora roreri MCA 2997]|uniref:F-box domain-containing protein n=1 Tax=Moniliophthora roreri (strain MCA 2997) TaxID=1381753 RepID=V2Y5N5_MONRO|nr:hypothetical protein Moror_3321 [Moniliophthora roreri MCA 2997]
MDRLAVELIHELAMQLHDDVDLRSLRLVNKTLGETVGYFLWDTRPAVIHLNRDNLQAGMSMLEDWKCGCEGSTRIRQLKIVSLSPQKELHPPQRCITFTGDGEWKMDPPEPIDTLEVKEALERLPEVLPGALCALKGLVSVQWTLNEKDHLWAQDVVMESLASLPLLARFEVDASTREGVPLSLHCFPKFRQGTLTRFFVKGGCLVETQEHTYTPESAFSTVLLHNPNIIELRLERYWGMRDFQSLIEQIPIDALGLKSLHLYGWIVKSTPKVISHFRSLHTLCLLNDGYPYDIWKSMQSAGISLRCLTVEPASSDLLDYLESFSGLKELSILHPDLDEEDSDNLGRRFYQDTLPKHSESLRKLAVVPPHDGSWVIGLDNVDVFDRCDKLCTLTVALKPDDIQPDDCDLDVVTHLITRLSQMPSIAYVELETVGDRAQLSRRKMISLLFRIHMENETNRAVKRVHSQKLSLPVFNHCFRVAVKFWGVGKKDYCMYVFGGCSESTG